VRESLATRAKPISWKQQESQRRVHVAMPEYPADRAR